MDTCETVMIQENTKTEKLPVANVTGVTEFDVTIGTNFNYPNGRGWGESFRMNGLETPVIHVSTSIVL